MNTPPRFTAVDDARRGAAFLDLIEEVPDRIRLTPLGREVVRFAVGECGLGRRRA